MYAHIFERKWIYGGPRDIWVTRIDAIGEFIAAQKLKPVPMENLPAHPMNFTQEDAARVVRPRPFPGGLLSPHLHFKGDIFLMNPDQWKAFSGTMIRQYQEKLGRAGTVSFTQLMDVAAEIDSLGP